MGTVEINLLQKYLFITKAIAAGELDKAADLMLALSPEFPVVDIELVKQDMVRTLRAWALRTPVKTLPHSDKSLTHVVIELAKIMTVCPQQLVNVVVKDKPPLADLPQVQDAIRKAEEELGDEGRVVVRYSGTELLCRVMVEGPTAEKTETIAQDIVSALASLR